MKNKMFEERVSAVRKEYEALLGRKNEEIFSTNGIFSRYRYPVLTRDHFPLEWRYDFNPGTNPHFMERFKISQHRTHLKSINSVRLHQITRDFLILATSLNIHCPDSIFTA